VHTILLEDEDLKFAAFVQPTSKMPTRSRWCINTDVASGFSCKEDSVPSQRHGHENYLEYIVCNGAPTVILSILDAN